MNHSKSTKTIRLADHLIVIILIVFPMISFMTKNVFAVSVGRVDYVEGNIIIIKIEQYPGKIIKSQRFEVFNLQGKRVATVKVEKVNQEAGEVRCKVMRGAGKIEPGYSVRPREELRWALIFGASMLPVKAQANALYTDLTGIASNRTGDLGVCFEIGAIFKPSPGFWASVGIPYNVPLQFQVTTGYVDLRTYSAWKIVDIGPIWRYEIYPERFHLEFGGSFSIVAPLEEDVRWARPEGTYNDKIDHNEGTTSATMMIYGGWLGINYQFTREFTFFVRGTYNQYYFGDYVDSEAPESSDDTDVNYDEYQIRDEWLESNITVDGGFGFSAGVQIWIK